MVSECTCEKTFKCVLHEYPPGGSDSFCTISRDIDYVILMPYKVISCMVEGVGAVKVKQAKYKSGSIVW